MVDPQCGPPPPHLPQPPPPTCRVLISSPCCRCCRRQERFENAPAAERLAVRVWNDVFVVDQDKPTADSEIWFTTIKDAVAQIGHAVLVLAPWNDPIPTTRAWCLWEICSTLVAGSTFEVVVAQAEVDGLGAAALDNDADKSKVDDALTNAMVTVDAQKAECFMPSDRVQVFAMVEATEGGFHRLNVEVKSIVRQWALGVVRGLCADDGWTDDRDQRAIMCSQVGSVLLNCGEANLALEHFKKSLATTEAVFGPDHEVTATSHDNIGSVLHELGDFDGAFECHGKSLEIREATLGDQHPTTATSCNDVGEVLHAVGDLDGALECHCVALAIRQATLGDQHPHTMASCNNIGSALAAKGDLNEAFQHCHKPLAIKEAALGEQRPSTAISCNNIGHLVCAPGDLDGALGHLRKALATWEASLGEQHPNTRSVRETVDDLTRGVASRWHRPAPERLFASRQRGRHSNWVHSTGSHCTTLTVVSVVAHAVLLVHGCVLRSRLSRVVCVSHRGCIDAGGGGQSCCQMRAASTDYPCLTPGPSRSYERSV